MSRVHIWRPGVDCVAQNCMSLESRLERFRLRSHPMLLLFCCCLLFCNCPSFFTPRASGDSTIVILMISCAVMVEWMGSAAARPKTVQCRWSLKVVLMWCRQGASSALGYAGIWLGPRLFGSRHDLHARHVIADSMDSH